jgi:hypothetical protein
MLIIVRACTSFIFKQQVAGVAKHVHLALHRDVLLTSVITLKTWTTMSPLSSQ